MDEILDTYEYVSCIIFKISNIDGQFKIKVELYIKELLETYIIMAVRHELFETASNLNKTKQSLYGIRRIN